MDLKYNLIEGGTVIEYFHASEDRQAVRDEVFNIISQNLDSIRLDSVVVEKRKTHPALQSMGKLYPKIIGILLGYVLDPKNVVDIDEVVIITDKIPLSGKRRVIEKAIKLNISMRLRGSARYKIYHHSSKSCSSLQVADYCNWAIFRRWQRGDLRSYRLINGVIRSEFDVFQSGTIFHY